MSTLDKVVKSACKPKSGPPKSKYLDTLVAATYSDDGSLQDIIRSLSLRLREPNATVVLKALITLHTLLRTGQTENLLTHLQNDQLRLRNVAGTNWDGASRPPSNMGAYAIYIDSRARCFKELQHDAVRTQSESNRRGEGLGAGSKARRLRHLAVEKGLLREVRSIQKVLDALVVCRFYEDDLHDECTVAAFRMCVKDLLILFQAGNEGVCNILEHYFEMSKPDATDALSIYKSFIAQTDRVVDYLGMARRLHNVVNVPVPNLKHAPTGLVKALDEYLNDPNFEQNRVEYKRSLGVVEGKGGRSSPEKNPTPTPATSSAAATTTTSSSSAPKTDASKATSPAPAPSAPPASANQKIQDFFESIQADQQPTMFGGPASNAFPQQQQQQLMPMFTGMPMMASPWGNQPQMQSPQGAGGPAFNPFRQSMMMPQQTGYLQPQMTGQMAFGGGAMGGGGGMPFMQPQQTGFNPSIAQPQPMQQQNTSFLQPQSTGANPFRQSMMVGGSGIGGSPFGQSQQQQAAHPFGAAGQHAMSQPTSPFQPQATGMQGAQAQGQGQGMTPFGSANQAGGGGIQRPGSTPALSLNTAFGPGASTNSGSQAGRTPQPLTAQPTGTKNPFAPAGGMPAPPVPKGPSMNELAANKFATFNGTRTAPSAWGGGAFGAGQGQGQGHGQGQDGPQGQSATGSGAGDTAASGMGGIASSFAFDSSKDASKSPSATGGSDWLSQFGSLSVNTNTNTNTGTSTSGTGFGTTNGSGTPATSISGLSAFSTGTGSNTNGFGSPSRAGASSPFGTGAGSGAGGFLQPQRTGFGGSTVKPFKPTSSFGSTLMETLPEAGSGAGATQQRPSLMSFDSDPAAGAAGAGASGASGASAPTPGGAGVGGATSPTATAGPGQGAAGQFGQFGQFGQSAPFGQANQQSGLVPNATGVPNPFRQSTMGGFGTGQGMTFGQGAFGGAPKQQHGLI